MPHRSLYTKSVQVWKNKHMAHSSWNNHGSAYLNCHGHNCSCLVALAGEVCACLAMPGYTQISFVTSCWWHQRLWSFYIMERELAIIHFGSLHPTKYRSTLQLTTIYWSSRARLIWAGVPSCNPGGSASVLNWSYRCRFQSNDSNRIKQVVFPNLQNKPQKESNSYFASATQLHSQFPVFLLKTSSKPLTILE